MEDPSTDSHASVSSDSLWRLAWPVVVTYSALALRQFTDTWMVGQLGTEALAGLLPAQQLLLLVQAFGFGMLYVLNTCVSHAYQKFGPDSAGAFAWQGIWVGLFFGGLAGLLHFFTEPIFAQLDHEFAVYVNEVAYFRIAIFSVVGQFVAVALANFYFAIRSPFPPMWCGLFHVALNIVANYILMFGIDGWFEGLGIAGAAWGTCIASFAWALALLLHFLFAKALQIYRTRRPVFSREKIADFLKIGLPGGAIDLIDVSFWNVALVLYIGSFGADYLAATAVLFNLWMLIFIPIEGLGVALQTLVGHHLALNDERGANRRLRNSILGAGGIAVAIGVGCVLMGRPIFEMVIDDEAVIRIGLAYLVLLPVLLALDSAMLSLDAALNGAGDAMWPLLAMFAANLLIIAFGGWVAITYLTTWGALGIWLCFVLNRAVIASVYGWRWKSGVWRDFEPVSS